jgi:hypothetical protein
MREMAALGAVGGVDDAVDESRTARHERTGEGDGGVVRIEPDDLGPLVVFLACDQARPLGGTLLSATAGDRAHIMVNRRWRGAILTAGGYGGLAGSSNAVGTPALKISDDKAAILEAMVILPSAIAMPAGHNADCVITITVLRTPAIVPVTQPVRDSGGITRGGLAATAAPISYGPSRRMATAT